MHTCPTCGQACYCNGDLDDCYVGDRYAEENCQCCDGEEAGDGDFDEDRDPVFCVDCDWHVFDYYEGHLCKVFRRNYVGRSDFRQCSEINISGYCPEFVEKPPEPEPTPRKSWWRRWLGL